MTRGRPPRCIHCRSTNSIAKGYRRTKYQGVRRIRVCRDCGRKFTPRNQKAMTEEQYRERRQAEHAAEE